MKVFVYLCVAVIIALAESGVIPSISETSDSVIIEQQPQPVFAKNTDEYDPNPQYNFAYDIQDGITGDSKSQSETRNGDIVRGQYALNDPDGFRRTVDYVADPVNGFNAIVTREPLGYTASAVATPVIKSHEPYLGAAVIKHHNQYQPLNYISSPALTLKTATLTNPTIQSSAIYPAHATYFSPASLNLTPSTLIRSGVLSAGAGPTLVKSTPVVYSAQPALTSPYAAGETIVKSSYSSPLVSYSY